MTQPPQIAPRIRIGSLRDLSRILFRHLGKALVVLLLVFGAIVGLVFTRPAKYESEARLLVRVGRENVALDLVAAAGRQVGITRTFENEIRSEVSILTSEDLLRKVVVELGPETFLPDDWQSESTAPEDAAIGRLDADLHADAEPNSNIIRVTYEHGSKDVAPQVLRRLIELYMEKHISVHRTEGAFEFLSQQADRIEEEMRKLRVQLDEIKADSGIYAFEEQRQVLTAAVAAREEEVATLSAGLADSEAKRRAIEGLLQDLEETRILQESTGQANPVADEMRSQLFQLMLMEKELLARFSPEHRQVRDVRARIEVSNDLLAAEDASRTTVTRGPNEIRRQLQLTLVNEQTLMSGYRAQLAIKRDQLADARARLNDLIAKESELKQLERKIALHEANHTRYLESREQAHIDRVLEEQKISNIRLVQAASRPTSPIGPQRSALLAAAVAIALFAAAGTVLFSEFCDESLATPDDVEARLGLPVLASLPRSRFLRSALSRLQHRREPWAGALPPDVERELGALVRRLENRDDSGPAVILGLTSNTSGVGVSSIAAYLAAYVAQRRQRPVLLIDGNHRDPTLTESFSSGYVNGNQRIRPTLIPGLSLWPAKDGLTASDWEAVAEAARDHSLVLVDLPPTQGSDDTVNHGHRCDGVLFIVDPEQTRWHGALRSVQTLTDTDTQIIGAVLNKRRFPIPGWLYRIL